MAFFQFGRKVEFSKEYSLEEIPVFSSLTPSEQKLIEKKARLVEFKRGDIVYEEGTPAEAFYVVISGKFRLFLKPKSSGADEQTLINFHRGDHFGETSLLTGRLHSASVETKRDGLILKLEKEDFLKLVDEIPSISRHLSRSLGHRLTRSYEHSASRHEVKISSLYSKTSAPAAFQFWLDFSGTVSDLTKRKVIVVDFVSQVHPLFKEEFQTSTLPDFNLSKMDPSSDSDLKAALVRHPKGFSYIHVVRQDGDKDEKKISTLLTFLTYRFQYLMIRLPEDITDYSFKPLKQSDMVYVYSGAERGELGECGEALKELQQGFGFGKSEIRLLAAETREKNEATWEEKESLLGVRIFTVVPSKVEQIERYTGVVRYTAKEFAGTLIGLALGSGAAYGLAHIGVFRVLEREGILPDIVAGCSIGALVAGLWAAGYNADEMERIGKAIDGVWASAMKLIGLSDFSLPHHGFLKGNQITRFLESYIGDKTFQELRVPVKIIAANLFTSEEVIIETGRVVDAIRASISIPGIFRPVFHNGQYLIDGGVVDPLPVRVLAAAGVKKIIAVNVLPGPKDRIERNRMQEEIRKNKQAAAQKRNFFKRMSSSTVDKVYHRYAVNSLNVIVSTIQFMEFEMASMWASQADVLIHPILREAHWAQFYTPDKFIKLGEEKTLQQIEDIKRLLVE